MTTMDHRRSYHAPSSDHAKRKSNSNHHHNGPTPKKPRPTPPAPSESNQFQRIYTPPDTLLLPTPIPFLPAIKPDLEKTVFTHPGTVAKGSHTQFNINYDRLEFLGDAYLELIATQLIYDMYTDMPVGGMCKLRESVVKNESLSRYTCLYGLEKKLVVANPPKSWTKVYGDVFEAYAAAVVLSHPEGKKGGEDVLKAWLAELWAPMLKAGMGEARGNAKEELAKKVLVSGVRLNYVEERKGIVHLGKGSETFFVGLYMDGWGWKNQHLGSGEGASKNAAGQQAALSALDNHPLIDEIVAKKVKYLAERDAVAAVATTQDEEEVKEGN